MPKKAKKAKKSKGKKKAHKRGRTQAAVRTPLDKIRTLI